MIRKTVGELKSKTSFKRKRKTLVNASRSTRNGHVLDSSPERDNAIQEIRSRRMERTIRIHDKGSEVKVVLTTKIQIQGTSFN